ncbi:MAG TPA: amino acid adenylation domain-containing protein, partial [Pseudonocardiaceae bacterium]
VRVDQPTWQDLVRATFEAELTILDHRAYPLFEIQRVAGRAPLFETLFDYRDFHVYDALPGGDRIEIVGQDFFEQTNLPFAAGFSRSRVGDLGLRLTYNRLEFSAEQMDRVARLYRAVLAALVSDPEADPRYSAGLLAGADLAPEAGWSRTGTSWPGPYTVPELVAAHFADTPEATALVWRGTEIRYGELGAGVNRLAHELTERGVRIGDTVGILLERGPELVTAVHAVLAAGAAYLPLDPELPPRRLALMCGGARLVVTTEQWRHLVPDGTAPVLLDGDAARIETRSAQPVRRPVPPCSPAYVIYTSGSTGTPKAVVIDHAAIVNRLRWMQVTFRLGPDDRVVHKTPFGFDVSVWELCWPLMTGAAIALAEPDGHRDSGYLGRLFAESRATTVHFVPSMLEVFLEDADAVDRSAGLHRIICSGEALPPALADRCHELLPAVELHNLYGPTEAAIDVSWHRCRPGERPLPIGAPIANTRLYVLDPLGEQAAVGTPGDLCIAGVQLAQGYSGRPGLTADQFRPDPFGPPGQRLYRTGDRARWLPGGEIEYLGRSDDQIKVRGMRIEPGE